MNYRTTIASAMALALIATNASAAGIYPGFDPSSASADQQSYVPTGNEFTAMDTQLGQGLNPATVGMMAYEIAGVANGQFRNALVGGDFGVAPWQRGTAASADIANTLTYYADQWWNLGGASSAINVTKVTTAGELPAGTAAVLKFQRKSGNANTAAICTGQVLTSGTSQRFQGQTAIFSAWLKAGANFSPASSNVAITIAYGTGTNESAANFASGAWTGYAAAYSANTTITTTMTRYSVAAAIPATATQVGMKICYTPVGTASTNDWFEMGNAQLEASGAAVPSGSSLTLSQYAQPSAFAFRHPAIELELAQHYFFQITEGATVYIRGTCAMSTTSIANCYVPFPKQLRAAPTMTYATGFSASASTASTSATACTANTTSATLTGSAASVNGVLMNCASSAGFGAAGTGGFLWDAGGTGKIIASAEL